MIDYKYIVMEGNPFEGYTFYGPFNDMDLASDFAEKNCTLEWYFARLNHVAQGGYYWSDEAKAYIAERGK